MSSVSSLTAPASACAEGELVAAVRDGSDTAFEELYGRYRGRVSRYVFRMVGDEARAEDVTQEVFISALRRIRATDREIAFGPWICEIAKNACVDEFRRTRRLREVPLEADFEPGMTKVHVRAIPDAEIESKQRLDDLRGAFGGLSETHHKIIVLRELEGRSYMEIGARMGISKPVVQSTLSRARRRLSQEYEEIASGRRCEQTGRLILAGPSSWQSLGLRHRRQLARHLAHCQPCRRSARDAGMDERFFEAPSVMRKIAALLPIPWIRLRRSRTEESTVAASGSHQLTSLAQLHSLAAPYADQVAPALGLGRAAAAAAALVIGGGLATTLGVPGGNQNSHGAVKTQSSQPVAALVRAAAAKSVGQAVARATSPTASARPPARPGHSIRVPGGTTIAATGAEHPQQSTHGVGVPHLGLHPGGHPHHGGGPPHGPLMIDRVSSTLRSGATHVGIDPPNLPHLPWLRTVPQIRGATSISDTVRPPRSRRA